MWTPFRWGDLPADAAVATLTRVADGPALADGAWRNWCARCVQGAVRARAEGGADASRADAGFALLVCGAAIAQVHAGAGRARGGTVAAASGAGEPGSSAASLTGERAVLGARGEVRLERKRRAAEGVGDRRHWIVLAGDEVT